VALGADDAEAAGGFDLFVALGDVEADLRGAGFGLGAFKAGEFALQAGFKVAAQFNVGAAAGHVGGDGDGAERPGFGDDLGFLFVEARVQHGMRDFLAIENAG